MGVELIPFLKWAGGKRWLADRLKTLFEVEPVGYREPFLGSGALFFKYKPRNAVLSDVNDDLISCYNAIASYPNLVLFELEKMQSLHSDNFYYYTRASAPKTEHERAARFLYLNRTCWNGLYRVNLQGQFNVPRGTKNAIVLPTDNFDAASALLKRADIRLCDFEQTIDDARPGELVFADPPYTVAHNKNGFIKYNQNIFSWEDQRRLAASALRASKRGVSIVITNADHKDVAALYSDFSEKISVSRHSVIAGSSENRKPTSELLISNLKLGL